MFIVLNNFNSCFIATFKINEIEKKICNKTKYKETA